jgi:hypothetical protein
LNSELILDRARSRCSRRRSAFSDDSEPDSAAVVESEEDTSFGLREKVSVRAETKMGVRPGMPAGKRGTGGVTRSDSSLGVSSLLAAALVSCSALDFWRSSNSCCFCFSLRRCLYGEGLRFLRFEKMEGPFLSSGCVALGSMSAGAEETTASSSTDDGETSTTDEAETSALLLCLALLRLSKCALLRANRLRLLKGNVGVARGVPVLTGVAMSVGVTSLRVMMATVVSVLLLWWRRFGLVLVRNRLGLITGVNVLLARFEPFELPSSESAESVSSSSSMEEAGLVD